MPRGATADRSSEELSRAAKQHQADLRDLLVSPLGNWAVAVIEKNGFQAIEVHEIAGGEFGRKLLALDFTLPAGRNHIVSAQWAVGNHVADWTGMVDTASKQGELKPRIVVDPARVRDVFPSE